MSTSVLAQLRAPPHGHDVKRISDLRDFINYVSTLRWHRDMPIQIQNPWLYF